ncbi:MAG: hypothetical protein WCL00_06795 [Bacteroidota bacterium]
MAHIEDLERVLNIAGYEDYDVFDYDTIVTTVNGEKITFYREDELSQTPGSHLVCFGSVSGDLRTIQAIAEEVKHVFWLIDPTNSMIQDVFIHHML